MSVDVYFKSYNWHHLRTNNWYQSPAYPVNNIQEWQRSSLHHNSKKNILHNVHHYSMDRTTTIESRMKIYLQSLNYELWNIVEVPYTKPITNYTSWSDNQKKNANLDAKVMNVLFCALTKEEFNRVSTTTFVNRIWHTLQVTHEGTNKVKESKISVLVHRFELFKIKENETCWPNGLPL